MGFTSYDIVTLLAYLATVAITYGSQTGVFGATNKQVCWLMLTPLAHQQAHLYSETRRYQNPADWMLTVLPASRSVVCTLLPHILANMLELPTCSMCIHRG